MRPRQTVCCRWPKWTFRPDRSLAPRSLAPRSLAPRSLAQGTRRPGSACHADPPPRQCRFFRDECAYRWSARVRRMARIYHSFAVAGSVGAAPAGFRALRVRPVSAATREPDVTTMTSVIVPRQCEKSGPAARDVAPPTPNPHLRSC
jgi:hypothetical protein